MPTERDAARAPRATYRLQLNADFTFADAGAVVEYLADLGVSHLYLSPILEAIPGSTHGYDVADPAQVSTALGGASGLRALRERAAAHGLGLVVDIVPNHVGIGSANPLWDALLAEGQSGSSGRIFDVDWSPPVPGAHGKVLVAVLGDQYGVVLHAGQLQLVREAGGGDAGRWRVRYHEHDFPLSPETVAALERSGGADALAGEAGDPESWTRLHGLLERQHYRLVHWRVGNAVVNYRRFFAVSTLAAVRVEDPDVFDATHRRIVELVADGVVDGLRVDHPDGLRDPRRYFARLAAATGGVWTVAEKILHHPERLRGWAVAGTTGYEFCNAVLGLFADPDATEVLDALDRRMGGRGRRFARRAAVAKREILATDLASEHRRLTALLWALAQEHVTVRDLDDRALGEGLARVLACMDVYRPYVDPESGRADAEDVAVVETAVEWARRGSRLPEAVFDFLATALTGRAGVTPAHLEVVARFPQLSSAVMAKGVEDTLFYRARRLLALNEVGGDPSTIGTDVTAFHEANLEQAQHHPEGMLTTSTHDTKRGEDTRLRMVALSELAGEWADALTRWHERHAGLAAATPSGPAPSAQDILMIFQTLVGVWPLHGGLPDGALRTRLHDYLRKFVREARERTSWDDPDAAYELGLRAYVDAVLDDETAATTRSELAALAHQAQEIAMVAGLAQTLLRCTAPGVPDTYQGCELWEDSLVDPDNRRPVDFALRARLLADLDAQGSDDGFAASLWAARRDGRVKLWVLSRALRVRRDHPGCFGSQGAYTPLDARGRMADHVVAFARTGPGGDTVVTVAPRLPGAVARDGWGETEVALPPGTWHDALTGTHVSVSSGSARLSELAATLPVALLVRTGDDPDPDHS